jgi:hypothetical protein
MEHNFVLIKNSHGNNDVCVNGYLYRNTTGGKPRQNGSMYYRCKQKDCGVSLSLNIHQNKIVKASPHNLYHAHQPENPGKIEVRKGSKGSEKLFRFSF